MSRREKFVKHISEKYVGADPSILKKSDERWLNNDVLAADVGSCRGKKLTVLPRGYLSAIETTLRSGASL